MKEFFEIVKTKLGDGIAAQGYKLVSENTGGNQMSATFVSETGRIRLEYDKKLFSLYCGGAEDADSELTKSQTYLFDAEAGDGAREAAGVANEFLDTLVTPSAPAAQSARPAKRAKNKDSDENDAVFFVNRIVTVLPECKVPLQQHKAHYEQLLPRQFCAEVVTAAQSDLFRSGSRQKLAEYFQLLDTMYTKGDLDVRSIIMQVLLADVSKNDYAYVEGYLSEDNRKAWTAARKLYGRNIRPEKKSAMARMAAYQAETLNGTRQ